MYLTLTLNTWTTTCGTMLALAIVVLACFYAPWRELAAKPERQHLWFGGIVVTGLFWAGLSIKASEAATFHPMFITTLCFMFGARLTCVLTAVALLITQYWVGIPLANWGTNYLIGVMPAIATITLVLRFIRRVNCQNVFIYMLGGGFAGSIACVLVTGLFGFSVIWMMEPAYFEALRAHIPSFFVLIFPEGFCNGAIISTATILSPNILRTYDDDFYLKQNSDD